MITQTNAVNDGTITLPGAITIRDLRVVRGGAAILRGINLSVPKGGIFGLIGPSGSGKSTLIRAIVGLQRIASGEVIIEGEAAGSASLRTRIGYMPQSAAVYEDLTARENLAFLAAIFRISRDRIDTVLKLVDLHAIADRPVATFSGGQRQRVSLAAAILPEPTVLLLDEPTVGLDPRLRLHLWALFRAWATSGTTVVISTHVMDEAAKVDRLGYLSSGRVTLTGAPNDLIARSGKSDLEAAVLELGEDAGGDAK